jgi:hypothetical protein
VSFLEAYCGTGRTGGNPGRQCRRAFPETLSRGEPLSVLHGRFAGVLAPEADRALADRVSRVEHMRPVRLPSERGHVPEFQNNLANALLSRGEKILPETRPFSEVGKVHAHVWTSMLFP